MQSGAASIRKHGDAHHTRSSFVHAPAAPPPRGLRRVTVDTARRQQSVSVAPRAFFGSFAAQPQATPVRRLQQLVQEPVRLGWPLFDPGQYQLDDELGRGSFGTVFTAVDQDTGARVAIKKIPKIRRNQQPSRTAAKLRREADLLQRLQGYSDRVVCYMGKYEDEFHVYIVTEVLEGGTLEEYAEVAGGSLDESTCKWLAADILRFFDSCHTCGVVYADAKPANFMIDGSDGSRKIKAIDLGCSQALDYEGERLEIRSGTPLYFAPEVFQRSYGTEADLWSLGIMLYQFVTGRNPWFSSLKGVVPADVEKKVLEEEIVYLPEEWSAVSPELQDLVRRLLTKSPTERITAAEALRHALFTSSQPGAYVSNVVPVPPGSLCLRTSPVQCHVDQ